MDWGKVVFLQAIDSGNGVLARRVSSGRCEGDNPPSLLLSAAMGFDLNGGDKCDESFQMGSASNLDSCGFYQDPNYPTYVGIVIHSRWYAGLCCLSVRSSHYTRTI